MLSAFRFGPSQLLMLGVSIDLALGHHRWGPAICGGLVDPPQLNKLFELNEGCSRLIDHGTTCNAAHLLRLLVAMVAQPDPLLRLELLIQKTLKF